MKNVILIVFIISIVSFNLYSKPILGILDIVAKEGVSKSEASILTDFVFDAVINAGSGKYKIIARDKRDELLEEQEFSVSVLCDETSCAVEIGRMLAAEYLITGSFTKFGSKYYLTLQIINVSSTEVVKSNKIGEKDINGIADNVEKCVVELFGGTISIKIEEEKKEQYMSENTDIIESEEIRKLPEFLLSRSLTFGEKWICNSKKLYFLVSGGVLTKSIEYSLYGDFGKPILNTRSLYSFNDIYKIRANCSGDEGIVFDNVYISGVLYAYIKKINDYKIKANFIYETSRLSYGSDYGKTKFFRITQTDWIEIDKSEAKDENTILATWDYTFYRK